MTRTYIPLTILLAAAAAGCGPTVGQQAAVGLSRLTIRNMGAVGTLINKDTNCGFSSTGVLQAATLVGDVGSVGTFKLTVENCTLDLGSETVVSEDCTGGKVTASGKVTVSATREVRGILTGSATSPVVPADSEAVTITVTSASVDGFKVINSKSKNKLTLVKGGFKGIIKPRLAASTATSATAGACSISTPNTAFSAVQFTEETEFEIEGDTAVTGTVTASYLSAFNGSNGTEENALGGTIEVASKVGNFPPLRSASYDVPPEGDDRGLDIDYNAGAFKDSYACTTDLATPESYACADLTPRVADGAARLTAKLFGTVVGMVDANTTCGFTSTMASPSLSGNVGDTGSLTLTLPVGGCVIEVPAGTELPGDCNAKKNIVGGKVTVSGTKTVTGRLTGSATTPVIPMSDAPATFVLTMAFEGFKVGDTGGPNAMLVKAGTLNGTLQPRTALANDTGACSVSSPVARFSNLTWGASTVQVTSSSGTFDLSVAASSLNAVNGNWDADVNTLSGTVTVGSNALTVPSDGMGLDPTFSQTAFDAGWTCNPKLVTPPNFTQCVFVAPLAQGVARLTPRTAGTVLSMINADTTCGFSATGASAPSTTLPSVANIGMDGQELVQTITNPCVINIPVETTVSTDCAGVTTRVVGQVSVTGTKTVRGFFVGDPTGPMVPTSRDPATFALTMAFDGFKVINSAATSTSTLTVNDGTITATMTPRTGMDLTKGACSISTPVLTFDNITWSNGDVTLVSDGRTFNLDVTASDLDAQNGTKGTVSNSLTGSITVDTAAITLPTPGDTTQLDPLFDQATFDTAYACTPNLMVATSDAMCSFRGALAQGVARLLIKDVGNAVSLLDKNNSCGFTFGDTNTTFAPGNMSLVPSTPAPGDAVTYSLTSSACAVTPPAVEVPTCLADPALTSSYTGTFSAASVVKAVGGLHGGPTAPVVPITRTAAQFTVNDLALTGFAAWDSGAAVTEVKKLTVTGTLDAVSKPVAGESIATVFPTPGGNLPVYKISTPVSAFENVTGTDLNVVLQSGAKTFKLTVNAVDLDAFNGSFGDAATGSTNALTGTITLDGQAFTLPVNPADTGLVPGYSQASFNAVYACTPDLKEVVPAQTL